MSMKKILLTLILCPFISIAQMDTSLKDSINGKPVKESYLLNSSGVIIDSKLEYDSKNYFSLLDLPTGYYFIIQCAENYTYTRRYLIQ